MFTESEPVTKLTDLFWARKLLRSSSSSSVAIVPGANLPSALCHAVTLEANILKTSLRRIELTTQKQSCRDAINYTDVLPREDFQEFLLILEGLFTLQVLP